MVHDHDPQYSDSAGRQRRFDPGQLGIRKVPEFESPATWRRQRDHGSAGQIQDMIAFGVNVLQVGTQRPDETLHEVGPSDVVIAGTRYDGYELMMEGTAVPIIQQQLGHASLATTQKYLDHIAPKDLVEAMQRREFSV